MGFFKLGTMTLGGLVKKPETLQYPAETKAPYSGQKGVVVNAKTDVCNLCGLCEKRCPANAIVVDRDKSTWSISHLSCIQCGYCISGCPKKALEMKGERPALAAKKEMEVIKIKLPKKTEEKKEAVNKG